jgi:hypothetical protein
VVRIMFYFWSGMLGYEIMVISSSTKFEGPQKEGVGS